MNAAAEAPTSTIIVNGARIELIDRGHGRPILFLHPHVGLDPSAPVLAMLAEGGRLIAPSHPGFGHSERLAGITTVDDLSYFYLDLIDALDLRDTLVIGVSLGAWIAAAIAVKSTARMARLVLANPVGIKVGDRETRDILDIFAMLEGEFLDLAFADPPYDLGLATKLAERWLETPFADILGIEHRFNEKLPGGEPRRYGGTVITFYRVEGRGSRVEGRA